MAYSINDVYELCEQINLTCISTEYIDIKSNLKFICTECGEIFERNFDNLKNRKSTICTKCGKKNSNKNRVFSYDYVKDIILQYGCELISEHYINTDEKLKIKCNCGNIFETSFYKFTKRNKRQCGECGRRLKAINNAISESEIIDMLSKDNYILLDRKIEGGDQKIYIQCDKKHEPYWVNVSKYKSTGRRCPHCQNSKGENKIEEILIDRNITFKSQYIFKDLIGMGGGFLRFDFAILNSDDNIKYLLEYDGEMHYEETGVGNDLKTQQYHDKLKDEYCERNNIRLLRIPYWEFDNIENIINNV